MFLPPSLGPPKFPSNCAKLLLKFGCDCVFTLGPLDAQTLMLAVVQTPFLGTPLVPLG